jgi:hypothetical protein
MTVRCALLIVVLGTAVDFILLVQFYPFTLLIPALVVAAVSKLSWTRLGLLTTTAAGVAALLIVALTIWERLSVTGRLAPIALNVAVVALLCSVGEFLGASLRPPRRPAQR